MNRKIKNSFLVTLALASALACTSCVTKRVGDDAPLSPPNMRTYYHPRSVVWKSLIQIIRNEYLMPFDYASQKNGNFASKEIRTDDQTVPKTKYRLSGSIKFDGSGIVVTLYRQLEFWDEKEKTWQSVSTDYMMETAILNRLSQKLGATVRKK